MATRLTVAERKDFLNAMLDTEGWKEVFIPALQREIGKRQLKWELTKFTDLGEVCAIQEELRLLKRMVNDPRLFVKVEDLDI